ncbi:unnamed protein product, partial [Urochloa humidicola]
VFARSVVSHRPSHPQIARAPAGDPGGAAPAGDPAPRRRSSGRHPCSLPVAPPFLGVAARAGGPDPRSRLRSPPAQRRPALPLPAAPPFLGVAARAGGPDPRSRLRSPAGTPASRRAPVPQRSSACRRPRSPVPPSLPAGAAPTGTPAPRCAPVPRRSSSCRRPGSPVHLRSAASTRRQLRNTKATAATSSISSFI